MNFILPKSRGTGLRFRRRLAARIVDFWLKCRLKGLPTSVTHRGFKRSLGNAWCRLSTLERCAAIGTALLALRIEAAGFRSSDPTGGVLADASPRLLARLPAATPSQSTSRAGAPKEESVLVLTQARSVRELSADEAARGYPVRLRGVVTYFNAARPSLFVQDATAGIYIDPSENKLDLKAGDLVEVEGMSRPGRFAPMVVKPQLRVLGPAVMPAPIAASLALLSRGHLDSQWVETRGVVRAVTRAEDGIQVEIAQGGFQSMIWLPGQLPIDTLTNLVDSEIVVQGVSATHFDEKRRLTGFHLFASRSEDIKVEKPAVADAFSLPARSIAQLLRFTPEAGGDHRIKVEGTVTLQRPGKLLFVEDDTGPLLIETAQSGFLQLGERVEVVGFPGMGDFSPILQEAHFRRSGVATNLPVAVRLTAEEALSLDHHGRLVRLRGQVLDSTVRPDERVLVLQGQDVIFPVFLTYLSGAETPLKIVDGSVLEVTGVCLLDPDFNRLPKTFRLLAREPSDLVVLQTPSWWSLGHSLGVMGGLSGACAVALAWVVLLRKRVRAQTDVIQRRLEAETALEQRYRELFENATDIVYTHNLEGRFRSINKAGERILGYSKDEFLELDVFHVVAPEYREMSRGMFERKLREGGQTTYELQLVTKSGERVWGEVSSRLVLGDNQPVGVHGVIRDISARKRAEETLQTISNLGHRLSAARSPKQAAEVIIELADDLLGWDACYLHLFTTDQKGLIPVMHFDTVEGQRTAVASGYVDMKPSRMDLKVRSEGKQLLLREAAQPKSDSPLIPFGDKGRPSASLMFVPIRHGAEVIGVLSIQSYAPHAYDRNDLDTLQGLADHCAGALERIRTAQAFEESERHFRALIENSSDGISVIASDGAVLYASAAVTRILGYSVEEDVGSNAFHRIHPEDREEARARFADLLKRPGGLVAAQFRTRHKDGTWRWVEGTGTNLLHDPSVRGVVLNYRDVTERKMAEQALHESERRFHKAFEATPVSTAISRLSDSRIADVNDGFLQLLGFARDEVIGRTGQELGIWVHPEERAEIIRLLGAQQTVRNRESRLRTKSGNVLDTLISAELIDFGNEPCALFITYDLSERLRLEGQLRHAQKMEAVGQLAAGIAHDFNNLMTIIQGHASLLLAAPGHGDETSESLKKVLVATERASSLTRQLLTFSRKQVMQPKLLDLIQIIASVSKMLQRLLGENIALRCQYPSALPAIFGDIGMVEQIILNLAVNARDAMPEGGRMTIAASVVNLDETAALRNAEARAGRFVCLSVSDTGCGMDAKTLSKIFEPFFTTKEVGKGTGLGLSIVYGVVKQHRGWIEVASELGHGTRFDLFFPAELKTAEPPTPVAPFSSLRSGTETILVVEDEPALRYLVSHLLRRQGYQVLEARTGREAMGVWQEHRGQIDLLLTDVVMPEGISGVDLAEQLHAEKPSLKVIYTSGYSQEMAGQRVALQEGVNFLPKPYHPPKLAQIVRDCLDAPATWPVPE